MARLSQVRPQQSIFRHFENVILLVIFINSIVLTLYDYKDRDSHTEHNKIIDTMNTCFTLIYTMEALLKILALGFVGHRNAYLRTPWNMVDFVVVLFG
jgi:hypothetical protein